MIEHTYELNMRFGRKAYIVNTLINKATEIIIACTYIFTVLHDIKSYVNIVIATYIYTCRNCTDYERKLWIC